jgi:hypothetical protein
VTPVIIGVVVTAVVLAIAAGAVGREARRLDALPPRAVFDIDEAVEWVADHLPEEVTAVLSYDEVRQLLEWTIEELRGLGVAGKTGEPVPDEIVVDERTITERMVARVADAGLEITPFQVQQVVAAQLGYLEAVSAIGPEPEERENGRKDHP